MQVILQLFISRHKIKIVKNFDHGSYFFVSHVKFTRFKHFNMPLYILPKMKNTSLNFTIFKGSIK